MKWAVVCLLLAVSVGLAKDDDRVRALERDVASVDTNTRMNTVTRAVELPDGAVKRRIFIALAHDPEPAIRRRALGCAVWWAEGREATAAILDGIRDPESMVREEAIRAVRELSEGDMQRIPGDGITSLLPAAAEDGKDTRFESLASLVHRQIDAGIAVSVSEILASALRTESRSRRQISLRCALRAVTIAPLPSASLPALKSLLASEDTRERTINLLVRARGRVAWSLLLEIEATASSSPARTAARAALDHHEGRESEYHGVLEDAVKNATDRRVRELARARLGDW